MIAEHFPALIVVTPLMMSFIIFAAGWWDRRLCFPLVMLTLAACIVFAVGLLLNVLHSGTIHYYLGKWEPPWGIEYVVDHLNAYMLIILAIVVFIVALYSRRSLEKEIPEHKIPQLYALFVLNVTGLLGITITGDLFNLYVLLEIASFSAYALVAVGDGRALLASFRYVVVGTIGACFYLLGVGFIYIMTGSLNLSDAARLVVPLYQSNAIHMAVAFLLVGIAVKMALYPAHIWLPDAYTYAPSAVSALMAPTMTKVGCYLLIRVLFYVFEPRFSVSLMPITTALGWMAVIAMIVCSVYAIAQDDLKKMLAYSTVAQIGYIALGISLANRAGLTGSLLHILSEAFTKGCLFRAAGAVMYKLGMRNVSQFRNLFWKMPFTMLAFTVAVFSMIGIPPTIGFFSKLYLLIGSLQAGKWLFVAAIVISTVLNVVYFFEVIKNAFFKPSEPGHARSADTGEAVVMDEVPVSMRVAIWIAAVAILVLGIFSGKIVSTIIQYAIPRGIL
jgi:multicomponent Na+:H+ antiporter subunit D